MPQPAAFPGHDLFVLCFQSNEDKLFDYKNLRTVQQIAAEAPFVTVGQLRWWIFHARTNGFASAVVKVGGRVYIDLVAFNNWLALQRLTA